MNNTPRPEGQDKIKQSELVDLMARTPLRNGEYVLDCCDGNIKMSQVRSRDLIDGQNGPMSYDEAVLYLRHHDLTKGQFRLTVNGSQVQIKSLKKYWMNREDF